MHAVECCLRGNCNKHKDCAYSLADDCMGKLLEDVLKLLKEQEAKCMTKEELSGLHEQQFVWLEGKHGSLYCLRIIGICAGNDGVTDIQYDTPNSYIELSTEKYGVKFRLWTAQPTDEQRQAVKWE